MINEQEKQNRLIKSHQRKKTLKMMVILLVMLFAFALITWLTLSGEIDFSKNPKVLFLYLFPVGIAAAVFGSWKKQRQKLAEMLQKERKRLSDNPYGYGIASEVMLKQNTAQKRADHPVLGAYWDEIRFPSIFHGVLWMRMLYAGGASIVFYLALLAFFVSQPGRLTWLFWGLICLCLVIANFVRSIRVYRYGVVSRSLFGQEVVFFRDIFDVSVSKSYGSKGTKIESMQMDLQCIGTDVSFYISDTKQAFYEHMERVASVIHQASKFPSAELQKELSVTQWQSINVV